LQELFILHLHGYVGDPDTIIISLDGYDHINFQEPVVQDFLTAVFATKTVLFIGFGFADQHIEHLLGRLRANQVIGHSTVFALVPSSEPPNEVRNRKFQDQLINPVYMHDSGDYGVGAITEWLSSLHDALNQIALSRKSPLAEEKPYLVDGLRNLFLSDNWPSLLTDTLALLPDRPDLRKMVRTGLRSHDISTLFDILSSGEVRQILIHLNELKRSSVIEDALSCLPPI